MKPEASSLSENSTFDVKTALQWTDADWDEFRRTEVPNWVANHWDDFIKSADDWGTLEPESKEAYKQRRQQQAPTIVLRMEAAAAQGDLGLIQGILREWSKESCDKSTLRLFASSFNFAVDGGHLSVAAYLIDHGVGFNWAHFKHALDRRSYPFLGLFLQRDFDLNVAWSNGVPGPLGYRPLFEDEHIIRWLVERGASPNIENEDSSTPISRAVISAPFNIVKFLIESGGPMSITRGRLVDNAVYRYVPDHIEVLDYLLTLGCQSNINELEFEDKPFLRMKTLMGHWVSEPLAPCCLGGETRRPQVSYREMGSRP